MHNMQENKGSPGISISEKPYHSDSEGGAYEAKGAK